MIDELKALEVDWSMKRTLGLLDGAIKLIEEGKAGQSKSELYSLIKLKVSEAEEYYEKPLESVDTYRGLAGIAKELGDPETAAHANKQIATYKAENLEFLGYRQAFFGNNVEACELYRKALELVPDYELASKDLEKSQRRVEKSTEVLGKLQGNAEKRGNKKDWIELGRAYLDLGKIDDAIKCFEQVLEEDEKDVDGIARLGTALACKGEFQEALSNFEKALEIHPKSMIARRGKNYVSYILSEGEQA